MTKTVTVTGAGFASARPDSVRVSFSVQGEGEDVATALDRASDAVPKVTAALRTAGVADADISTATLSVEERYSQVKQEMDGYLCRHSLSVILHDIEASGQVLRDMVTAAGDAVRIHQVTLELTDHGELLVGARAAAFADAKAKAKQYAKLAGARLGAVEWIDESNDHRPRGAVRFVKLSGSYDSGSVPIEPGQLGDQASITVRWALKS